MSLIFVDKAGKGEKVLAARCGGCDRSIVIGIAGEPAFPITFYMVTLYGRRLFAHSECAKTTAWSLHLIEAGRWICKEIRAEKGT